MVVTVATKPVIVAPTIIPASGARASGSVELTASNTINSGMATARAR